jgi:hypothetical protein
MAMATDTAETKASSRRGVTEDARLLLTAVDGALRESEGRLLRWMEQSPILTLGAAAGVGYLLGGGLTPRIATRLITTGGRMMLAATLERWVADQLGLTEASLRRATAREEDSRKEVR